MFESFMVVVFISMAVLAYIAHKKKWKIVDYF
jgi:hypothetical protein